MSSTRENSLPRRIVSPVGFPGERRRAESLDLFPTSSDSRASSGELHFHRFGPAGELLHFVETVVQPLTATFEEIQNGPALGLPDRQRAAVSDTPGAMSVFEVRGRRGG